MSFATPGSAGRSLSPGIDHAWALAPPGVSSAASSRPGSSLHMLAAYIALRGGS